MVGYIRCSLRERERILPWIPTIPHAFGMLHGGLHSVLPTGAGANIALDSHHFARLRRAAWWATFGAPYGSKGDHCLGFPPFRMPSACCMVGYIRCSLREQGRILPWIPTIPPACGGLHGGLHSVLPAGARANFAVDSHHFARLRRTAWWATFGAPYGSEREHLVI